MRWVLLLSLLLCGCSPMTNYTASIDGHDINNKRGALLSLTKSDGTVIISDDRGYPEQPGAVSQAMALLLVGVAK